MGGGREEGPAGQGLYEGMTLQFSPLLFPFVLILVLILVRVLVLVLFLVFSSPICFLAPLPPTQRIAAIEGLQTVTDTPKSGNDTKEAGARTGSEPITKRVTATAGAVHVDRVQHSMDPCFFFLPE